jgi:hypothetical protein
MNARNTLIAFGTALAIGLGALVPTGAAQAAPASPAAIAAVQVDNGIQDVGRRYYKRKRYHKGYHVYVKPRHYHHAKRCYFKRFKVYSHYHHGYVWKKRKICRYW